MNTRSVNAPDEVQHGQIARNWRLHSLYRARAMWSMPGTWTGCETVYERAMAPPNPVEAPCQRRIPSPDSRHYADGGTVLCDRRSRHSAMHCVRRRGFPGNAGAAASAKIFLAHAFVDAGTRG